MPLMLSVWFEFDSCPTVTGPPLFAMPPITRLSGAVLPVVSEFDLPPLLLLLAEVPELVPLDCELLPELPFEFA